MKALMMLRWLAITGFGGYGTYVLLTSLLHITSRSNVHWAAFWFFGLPFLLAYSGLFIATGYFILRRNYRPLCTLVSALASLVIFCFLMGVSKQLGIQDQLHDWSKHSPWFLVIAFPLSLAVFLIPFYAARWIYRRGQTLFSRFIIAKHVP